MLIFHFNVINENKNKFFKIFYRRIIKNINNLPINDSFLKSGLKVELKKFIYIDPKDKYSNYNKNKYRKQSEKEIHDDYFTLYHVNSFLNKCFGNIKSNQNVLSKIVYFFYYSINENIKRENNNSDDDNSNLVPEKKKYSTKLIRDILSVKYIIADPLILDSFPKEIRNNVIKIIETEEEISKIYTLAFNINHLYFPQYMKSEFGYDYEDVKRLKEELNLYDVDNMISVFDFFNPKSVDNYYLQLIKKSNS